MTRRRSLGAAAVALVLAVSCLGARPGRAGAAGLIDFVTFDRIDYLRWVAEPGRSLGPGDLGVEFATVGCSVGEDVRGCTYGMDAAAAFLPAGTRMYAVRGYRTEFRLAAVWRGRVFLYQAWRNPRAKVGGDLFDIAGRVRAVGLERGEPSLGPPGRPTTLASARDAGTLVDLVVRAPMHPPRAHPAGEARYWLTFWLADGTVLDRPYFPESGEIMGGVAVPPEFTTILERYLRE